MLLCGIGFGVTIMCGWKECGKPWSGLRHANHTLHDVLPALQPTAMFFIEKLGSTALQGKVIVTVL